MKKTISFIAGLLLALTGMAQENKGGISGFMKEELEDFDKFMDDADKDFINFMREPWKEFGSGEAGFEAGEARTGEAGCIR